MRGIEYLRAKLTQKKKRVDLRYTYYEMKNAFRDLGIMEDARFQTIREVVGWAPKAVDSLADRLVFRRFKKDDYNINVFFDENNPDVFFSAAILSALIGSCSFVYIRKDEDDRIRLEVIDGGNATGVIDPTTMLLKEGYAVLERNDSGDPTLEAYFIPGEVHLYKDGILSEVVNNPVDFPLLVPVVNRPDPRRWFGRSRISRANAANQERGSRDRPEGAKGGLRRKPGLRNSAQRGERGGRRGDPKNAGVPFFFLFRPDRRGPGIFRREPHERGEHKSSTRDAAPSGEKSTTRLWRGVFERGIFVAVPGRRPAVQTERVLPDRGGLEANI